MEVLLGLILSVVAGFVPLVIYMWFIDWLDQYEKEPRWLLFLAFSWGAIPAIFMSIVAQVLLDIPTTWVTLDGSMAYNLLGASVWAPVTEEIFKGMGVLLVVLVARYEIDDLLDGIIYGAMVGLGFAFIENIFYFLGALLEKGWGGWVVVILLRTVLFGLNHAFFTGMFGLGIAMALHSPHTLTKLVAPFFGLGAAMLFHALHNAGVTLAAVNGLTCFVSLFTNWGGLLVLAMIVVLIVRQERRWMLNHLKDELTPEAYQLVISWMPWLSRRMVALFSGNVTLWRKLGRIRQTSAELAFKKQHLLAGQNDPHLPQAIAQCRAELVMLGVSLSRD